MQNYVRLGEEKRMKRLFREDGFTLVEAMVATCLLGGLALGVMEVTNIGFRGTYNAESRYSFVGLTNAIAMSIESQQECSRQLVSADLTLPPETYPLGHIDIKELTPAGYKLTIDPDHKPVFGNYYVQSMSLDSLEKLDWIEDSLGPTDPNYDPSADPTDPSNAPPPVPGNFATLSLLKIVMAEATGPDKPVKSLGQPTLTHQFYVLTTFSNSNRGLALCVSGRWMNSEDIMLPDVTALPRNSGLIAQVRSSENVSGGGDGAPATCADGVPLPLVWAQAQVNSSAKAYAMMPFFPRKDAESKQTKGTITAAGLYFDFDHLNKVVPYTGTTSDA